MSRDALSVKENPGGSLRIMLSGELDLTQADGLRRLLLGTILRCPRVTLDMANVTVLDGTILGVLVRSRRIALHSGGWLRISECHPRVRRILEITDLDHDFGLTR